MTRLGLCRQCRAHKFELTVSSVDGRVMVNCANCQSYIGTIPVEHIGQIRPGDGTVMPTVVVELSTLSGDEVMLF